MFSFAGKTSKVWRRRILLSSASQKHTFPCMPSLTCHVTAFRRAPLKQLHFSAELRAWMACLPRWQTRKTCWLACLRHSLAWRSAMCGGRKLARLTSLVVWAEHALADPGGAFRAMAPQRPKVACLAPPKTSEEHGRKLLRKYTLMEVLATWWSKALRSIIWKQYGSSEGQSKVARTESTLKKDCCWHVVMAQQLGGLAFFFFFFT